MNAFAAIVEAKGKQPLRRHATVPTIDLSTASRPRWRSKNQVGWTSVRNPLKFPISRMHGLLRRA
jgi:hypothetical protein